ncbi:MAG: hypothetical protein JW794_06670 [Candidatus Cloacimonetes bacterium]|nr:hypothetical protein [Candidatus Cloacimonadota bacterium]
MNALFFCEAEAEIIHIPADFSSIQVGINNASAGDTILVDPGTYGEKINFNGSNITIASLYLTTQDTSYISQTIIDGDHIGSVVTFENGEDSTAILYGFTLTNGSTNYGGGIYCNNASPHLESLIITDNVASYVGGGIYCENSSPILKNVTISDNNGTSYGGGLFCRYNSSPSLENLIISCNTSNHGGGICCLFDSSPSLKNVVISNNSATWYGGGIGCFYDSDIYVENVTIVGNSASDRGAGIYCYASCPSLVNTIVACNVNNYGLYAYSCEPSVSYSNFYNNEFGNFCGCGDTIGMNVITNINGDSCDAYYNIQEDPLFVDSANGDYHLSWLDYPVQNHTMSPCIDAGYPKFPPDPDGTLADIGAFYFNQDVTIDEQVQSSELNFTLYPNPVHSRMNNLKMSFFMKDRGHISLQLFNIKGQLILTLLGEEMDGGEHSIMCPMNGLSSGIYFMKLGVYGIGKEIKKIVLIK